MEIVNKQLRAEKTTTKKFAIQLRVPIKKKTDKTVCVEMDALYEN